MQFLYFLATILPQAWVPLRILVKNHLGICYIVIIWMHCVFENNGFELFCYIFQATTVREALNRQLCMEDFHKSIDLIL